MNKRQKEVIHEQLTMEKLVLDELEKEYRAVLKDINLKIQMYQAMPETQSKIYHRQYQETLKKQIEAALEKLHSDEYATINEYLHASYTTGFVGTMYDLHGQGVPVITPIDQNAVIKAVMTDTKLNKPLYSKLGVDVNKLKRTVSSEISRGLASGMTYDSIARSIEFRSKAPLSRAKTIVRTEGHRIQQASGEDARLEAKAKGADVVGQWDSTMDGETRPTHRQLDGQIREIGQPFEVNGKKAMYPGGFGDPAEDCNCRCVKLTRARSALDEDELETLKERAKFFGLDKTKDFEEFKQKFLKAAEKEKQEESTTKLLETDSIKTKKTARNTEAKTPETLDTIGIGGIMDMDESDAFQALSDDLPERSKQVDQLLDRHSSRGSKWSGTTIVKKPNEMPNAMGTKEWSCDITLREDSGIKTAVHEHLHARSCSYYTSDVYRKWQRAEEGAVELYAQEICKKNGVSYRESYAAVVKQLRIAHSIMKEYDSEYEFAKAFFEVELPNRYAWLRAKADKLISEGKLSTKTVTTLNIAVNSLYGKV